MDDLELAKKAIHRNLLTEEQLREGMAYSAGGRSLISVLLDLGYLNSDQVVELGQPAHPLLPPRRGGRFKTLVFVFFVFVTGVLIGRAFRTRDLPDSPSPYNPASAPRSTLGEELSLHGRALLAGAEQNPQGGRPEREVELRRAAALLEEARMEGQEDASTLASLGRVRELLDQWESSFDAYRKAARAQPDHAEAQLGAARMALFLERYHTALEHAQAAIQISPMPEAYLLRGQARVALGKADGARLDFRRAGTGDPKTASAAAQHLQRLGPGSR